MPDFTSERLKLQAKRDHSYHLVQRNLIKQAFRSALFKSISNSSRMEDLLAEATTLPHNSSRLHEVLMILQDMRRKVNAMKTEREEVKTQLEILQLVELRAQLNEWGQLRCLLSKCLH